jgi:hypothetical protein
VLAKIRWSEIVGRIEETVNAHKTLDGNLNVKDHFGIDMRTILKCKF